MAAPPKKNASQENASPMAPFVNENQAAFRAAANKPLTPAQEQTNEKAKHIAQDPQAASRDIAAAQGAVSFNNASHGVVKSESKSTAKKPEKDQEEAKEGAKSKDQPKPVLKPKHVASSKNENIGQAFDAMMKASDSRAAMHQAAKERSMQQDRSQDQTMGM